MITPTAPGDVELLVDSAERSVVLARLLSELSNGPNPVGRDLATAFDGWMSRAMDAEARADRLETLLGQALTALRPFVEMADARMINSCPVTYYQTGDENYYPPNNVKWGQLRTARFVAEAITDELKGQDDV